MRILDIWLYRYASTLYAQRGQPALRRRSLAHNTKRQRALFVPQQGCQVVYGGDKPNFFGLLT